MVPSAGLHHESSSAKSNPLCSRTPVASGLTPRPSSRHGLDSKLSRGRGGTAVGRIEKLKEKEWAASWDVLRVDREELPEHE